MGVPDTIRHETCCDNVLNDSDGVENTDPMCQSNIEDRRSRVNLSIERADCISRHCSDVNRIRRLLCKKCMLTYTDNHEDARK